MDPLVLKSFLGEFYKMAAPKEVTQLLADLARRKGLRPSLIPSIKQVGVVATRDRSRAADIAKNVKGALTQGNFSKG